MYTNLRLALKQKDIAVKQYADFLGVAEKTIQNKLNGSTEFTYSEFWRTCNLLLPEYNANYLFKDCRKNEAI